MGREIRRVPLSFDWPLEKVWQGFLMPDSLKSIPCNACDQSGYNPATRQLQDDWYDHEGFGTRWGYAYGLGRDGKPASKSPWLVWGTTRRWQHSLTQDEVQALVEQGRLWQLPGVEEGRVPTAAEVNEWSEVSFGGHDAINRMICVEVRAKRLGVYGHCEVCKGEGQTFRDEDHASAFDAWEKTDPPEGDAYQCWEHVSEGSPISPPFATPEELARWLADNNKRTIDAGTTYETWLKFIKGPGWALSMVTVPGKGLITGVEAAVLESDSDQKGEGKP